MASVDHKPKAIEEEINLHALILSLTRRWVVLVVFMIFGGLLAGAYQFIKQPSYLATAMVFIDDTILVNDVSPLYLVQSDLIRSEVVQTLAISQEALSNVTFSTPKSEPTIVNISVESEDPFFSVELVNTWAEIAVERIQEEFGSATLDTDTALQAVDTADEALLGYLQENGLGDLTWVDLVSITGASDQLGSIFSINEAYPSITSAQRLELAELVRQKALAEWNFIQVNHFILTNAVTSEHAALVINRAVEAERSDQLMTYLIIPLGVIGGLFLAIGLVLISDWWKSSQPVDLSGDSSS